MFGDNPYNEDAREGISKYLLNTATLILSIIQKLIIQQINEFSFLLSFYSKSLKVH